MGPTTLDQDLADEMARDRLEQAERARRASRERRAVGERRQTASSLVSLLSAARARLRRERSSAEPDRHEPVDRRSAPWAPPYGRPQGAADRCP